MAAPPIDGVEPLVTQGFLLAQRMHGKGDLAAAEKAYRQILARSPLHAPSIHYLGMIAYQTGHLREAIDLVEQSLKIDPKSAEAMGNLARLYLTVDRVEEAVVLCRRAISISSTLRYVYANLGEALRRQGEYDEAIECYRVAIEGDSSDKIALVSLASCLHMQGRFAEAEEVVDRAVAADNAEANYLKGAILCRRGESLQAIDYFMTALRAKPDHLEAGANLTAVLQTYGQFDAAEAVFKTMEASHPNNVTVLRGAVSLYGAMGKGDEALEYGRRALAIDDSLADVHSNMAAVYWRRWDLDVAEPYARRAVLLAPDHSASWSALSAILRAKGETQEALAAAQKSYECDRKNVANAFNLSLLMLALGDLAKGWEHYEYAIHQGQRRPNFYIMSLPPLAVGESPAGKRVVVRREQGVGDMVYFASVIPDLIAESEHCIVECNPKLKDLFTWSFPNATVMAEDELKALAEDGRLEADRQTMIGSLPWRYRSDLEKFPHPHKFLHADPERVGHFRNKLDALPGRIKVGLCWRSRSIEDIRAPYYLTLEQLAPLLNRPEFCVLSLQYDDNVENIRGEAQRVREALGFEVHLFDDLDTFDDLAGVAAALEACDIVVGAPSTVIHIAGGLGRPTLEWCSIPIEHNLGQNYCPMTPSVRAIMPKTAYDKETIVRLLGEELPKLVAEATGDGWESP